MTDLDLARQQMEDLIAWWPDLTDHQATLYGLTGHGIDMAGVRTVGSSPVETAVLQTLRTQTLVEELEELAAEWAWRGSQLDGPVLLFLHARLPWASARYPMDHAADLISRAHSTVRVLTGHAPRPTGHSCPGCGKDQLLVVEDEMMHCDTCDLTRTPEEILALTRWRLIANQTLVTRKEAAEILGEHENTIRQRIRRRQLEYELVDGTRRYILGDLK